MDKSMKKTVMLGPLVNKNRFFWWLPWAIAVKVENSRCKQKWWTKVLKKGNVKAQEKPTYSLYVSYSVCYKTFSYGNCCGWFPTSLVGLTFNSKSCVKPIGLPFFVYIIMAFLTAMSSLRNDVVTLRFVQNFFLSKRPSFLLLDSHLQRHWGGYALRRHHQPLTEDDLWKKTTSD